MLSVLFVSQEFVRCANDGQEALLPEVLGDFGLNFQVGDVPTIPRQRIIHDVYRGNRAFQASKPNKAKVKTLWVAVCGVWWTPRGVY